MKYFRHPGSLFSILDNNLKLYEVFPQKFGLFVTSSYFCSTMQTVVLQDLSIGYLAKGHQKVVASGLTASIESGQLTCLLGQNGIGKSTLLRTLSAFQPPLSGDILLNTAPTAQRSLTHLSDRELSRLIGVVLTEKPDVQNLTVREMVGMGRSPYTGFWGTLTDDDQKIVDDVIRLVGIETLQERMVQTLSDGERQKVMIAKALAQQTPVIYLDEPTAFLDFPSKVEIMQLLRRLAVDEEKTIFLSTHDVELALQLADSIWLMEPQSVLSVGTPQELAAQGVLGRFIERDGITFDKNALTIQVSK